jgi:hypothetical protein
MVLAEGSQGLFEQRHEPRVASGPLPTQMTAVAERGAGEDLRQARVPGDITGRQEHLLGVHHASGLGEGIAAREEQFGARRGLDGPLAERLLWMPRPPVAGHSPPACRIEGWRRGRSLPGRGCFLRHLDGIHPREHRVESRILRFHDR